MSPPTSEEEPILDESDEKQETTVSDESDEKQETTVSDPSGKEDVAVSNEKIMDIEDYMDWTIKKRYPDPHSYVLTIPEKYSRLERFLERNVVIGRAFGKRVCSSGSTFTQFEIVEVLNGDLTQGVITILEAYAPDESTKTIDMYFESTMLLNDQLVLLILGNEFSGGHSGSYYMPDYHQIQLPEDYKAYDDAYRTELFDYFRYKPGTRKQRADGKTGIEKVTTETGTVIYYYGGDEKELNYTDEEMAEKLSECILYRLADRYKIKIWPGDHVRFEGRLSPYGNKGVCFEWRIR